MATRARPDRLEVHVDLPAEAVPGSVDGTGGPSPEPTTDTGADGVRAEPAGREPADEEMYGVRTTWQSEAVRIEAAEFLVATRVQESSRRRLARLTQRWRDQSRGPSGG